MTVLLGIVGAVVGRMLAASLGYGTMSGFDIRSLMVAVSGALVLLIGIREQYAGLVQERQSQAKNEADKEFDAFAQELKL